jgi:phenylpyruvate tautomerase PptA (4-oxalocrotonate tautomerase family)
MAQVKIYGNKEVLKSSLKIKISMAIHSAVMYALAYPPEKKFHRFIELDEGCFIYPSDRTENYILIEIAMFEGRSVEAKKSLIHSIYKNIETAAQISAQDIEITITETPKCNWGIRGKPGDELALKYKVEV